ncbi:MAG: trypsin-like peptidase domain-containing protein [Chloroflexi bacterium]|nr:trypsin-like peptidase domain-containing protein [Chloroflexota bacterium]
MDDGDLVANFADSDCVSIGPFPHPTQMTIMPVVAMKGDDGRVVGTCFAISSRGLVLTARHVIEDAQEIDAGGMMADPDMGIGVLDAAETGRDDKPGG